MINLLKLRNKFGKQYIKDPQKAIIHPFHRGLPKIKSLECPIGCDLCLKACPAGAIQASEKTIDLGKCVFCGDCALTCPIQKITFTNYHKISATDREKLIINPDRDALFFEKKAIEARSEIKKLFGRSLKLRQVSAGGCNGCEWELNACGNINFDMGRYGIEFVASPRHADGIVITGPVSANMAKALEDAFEGTPGPKIIILTGACAISGGVFQNSQALDRSFIENYPIDLYIPGCPVHPLTFINGVLAFLGKAR